MLKKEKSMILPTKVNILRIEYTIDYKDDTSEVDIYGREPLWGQIDYLTHTIRIFKSAYLYDTWRSLLHEITHGVVSALKIESLHACHLLHDRNSDKERDIDSLALGLTDVLLRNNWLRGFDFPEDLVVEEFGQQDQEKFYQRE